jgi:dolichyl-phosphate beta-glucosyltransferase
MAPSFTRYESEHFYTDTNKVQHRFPSLADKPTLVLTVIVPAKDEELRLPAMLDDCLSHLQKRQDDDPKFTYEVIIVDDGSTDGTLQVCCLN